MHLTTRVVWIAAVLSAMVSGQEPQRRLAIRPFSPPDYLDNRTVDVARIAPSRCTVEIDNERLRVIRFRLPANTRVPIHGHRRGVIVAVTEVRLRVTGQEGSAFDIRLPAGDIRWMDPAIHSEENVGESPVEYLYIEAKD